MGDSKLVKIQLEAIESTRFGCHDEDINDFYISGLSSSSIVDKRCVLDQ